MMHQTNKMGCCFVAGTKVKLPSGEKDIASLAVGDTVVDLSLVKAKQVLGKVTRVDIDQESVILVIGFDNADSLICTPSQRLRLGGSWVLSREITVGMKIGELRCCSVQVIDWNREVFTLVVEPWNNYVVLSRNGAEIAAHDNSSDLG